MEILQNIILLARFHLKHANPFFDAVRLSRLYLRDVMLIKVEHIMRIIDLEFELRCQR